MAVFGCANDIVNGCGQFTCVFQFRIKICQFCLRGKVAIDQQIRDFFKCGLRRKCVDGISTIAQGACRPVDMAHGGAFEINAFKATVDLDVFAHCWLLSQNGGDMTVLETSRASARTRPLRVVFPELGDDERVAEAARILETDGLAHPMGLSDPTPEQMAALVEGRGMKEAIAKRMLNKPLYRAAAMVAAGEADVMVAGADSPTRRVIEAASIAIGLDEGVHMPSSFFLICFPDGRELIFADCAVNVSPNSDELLSIAMASENTAARLLGAANVAMLSFSTGASGTGESVDLVREAAEAGGYIGPIQADAALNATIAAKKGLGQGDANVLIFPDLNSGNIAYKLCQELAGAQAIGPFLQGFKKPVCDLSRGATVDDIVAGAIITSAMFAD